MLSKHSAVASFLLVIFVAGQIGVSVAQDTKTLTIKGSNTDSGDTIEIPSSAEVSVVVGEGGIVLTMPQLDVRLRCLGEATANGYCYIAADSGGGALVDGDGDNVPDSWDTCPNTPSSATVINTSGCADIDGDGYYENNDDCPNQGGSVDSTGCPTSTGAPTYTVTASAGTGGTISPSGEVTVSNGATRTFTVTASSGYQISSMGGDCSAGSLVGDTYTTGAVTADCTVIANFSQTSSNTGSYCSNIPSALQGIVICRPNASGEYNSPGGNMDNWSEYTGYIGEAEIPARKIVSYPFTANAAGQSGRIKFTTNMGRVRDNMTFKAWFSEAPGGPELNTTGGCRERKTNPNPAYLEWQQINSTTNLNRCGLGTAERTLYLNVELACHNPELGCTEGERYPYNYYVEINNGEL